MPKIGKVLYVHRHGDGPVHVEDITVDAQWYHARMRQAAKLTFVVFRAGAQAMLYLSLLDIKTVCNAASAAGQVTPADFKVAGHLEAGRAPVVVTEWDKPNAWCMFPPDELMDIADAAVRVCRERSLI
jgi:hypothetical protein